MLTMQAKKFYLNGGVIKYVIDMHEKVENAYIMSIGNKYVGLIAEQTSDLFTNTFKSIEIPHHKGDNIFKAWWQIKVNGNLIEVYIVPKRVVKLSEDVVIYDVGYDKEILNPILEFYHDFSYYKSMANLYMLKLHKRFLHVRRDLDIDLQYRVCVTRGGVKNA